MYEYIVLRSEYSYLTSAEIIMVEDLLVQIERNLPVN